MLFYWSCYCIQSCLHLFTLSDSESWRIIMQYLIHSLRLILFFPSIGLLSLSVIPSIWFCVMDWMKIGRWKDGRAARWHQQHTWMLTGAVVLIAMMKTDTCGRGMFVLPFTWTKEGGMIFTTPLSILSFPFSSHNLHYLSSSSCLLFPK